MSSPVDKPDRNLVLRAAAEEVLSCGSSSETDAQCMLHELQVHQIELQMQNEALRSTQNELEASRESYVNLYEFAPVGYITLSLQGEIEKLNLTLATWLDLERDSLIGRDFSRLLVPEDKHSWLSFITRFGENSHKARIELGLHRCDGTVIQVRLDCVFQQGSLQVAVTDVTARKQADTDLLIALNEKTALLKEVHHRVKNNLQLVSSLLNLEAQRNFDDAVSSVLSDMKGRIHSMALLHEMLYQTDVFAGVDLGDYITKLAVQVFRVNSPSASAVSLEVDVVSLPLDISQALPCGLVVNELLLNSLKHGFPVGEKGVPKGVVRLELVLLDGLAHLAVSDNGVGLAAGFKLSEQASLGLILVSDLARQLGGRLHIETGLSPSFKVIFPPKGIQLQS
ncbi:PAS domain S-box-containing protein [Alteromonadaceae bacterium Bs31]|nr:PAS domain S-box-containing protein [Alteromonadaceae bacterium Bs31]